MELRPTVRSLRTIEDLLTLQRQRADRQQAAVNAGLEHFVQAEEAKAQIAIRQITAPPQRFEGKA